MTFDPYEFFGLYLDYNQLQFQAWKNGGWKDQLKWTNGNASGYDGLIFSIEGDYPEEFIPVEHNPVTVYFDSTFSGMPISAIDLGCSVPYYADADTDPDVAYQLSLVTMPRSDGTLLYYAQAASGDIKSGEMERVTGTAFYKVDLTDKYTKIVFSSMELTSLEDNARHKRGGSTKVLTIPTDIENPCFVADPNDNIVYNENFLGGFRQGYWTSYSESGYVRNPAAGKGRTVVDIPSGTYTEKEGYVYFNSDFYDYYSDFEVAGYNRDNYPLLFNARGDIDTNRYRTWYQYRILDTALSDRYSSQSAIPLYIGQFQPTWDGLYNEYASIADVFPLYGYADNADRFLSVNNAHGDVNGNGAEGEYHAGTGLFAYAAQGLVGTSLSGETLMSKGSGALPLFDKSFLNGNNSLSTVVGRVFEDVSFPFQKQTDEYGIDYWVFDSAETTVQIEKDGSQYFLNEVDESQRSKFKNVTSSGTYGGVGSANEYEYGFFPFNSGSTDNKGDTYNFGFGVKLDIDFALTKSGTLFGTNGERVPITFHIRGDDDIWVFIDGKLVLDVGGDHGEVEGTINFADKVATVSKVKSSWGSSTSGTDVQNSFSLDPGTDHVMTIFYLERGMWGSNLMMDFNFPFELPQPELYNLTVTEEIYGEAPRTDEFTFTIYIDNTDYDLPTEYEVVGSRFGDGEKIVFEPLYRPQSLEDMSGGALVATFTLGHEERITIKGFPDYTEYEIVQSGGIPKYETKVNGTLKADRTASGKFAGADRQEDFANGYYSDPDPTFPPPLPWPKPDPEPTPDPDPDPTPDPEPDPEPTPDPEPEPEPAPEPEPTPDPEPGEDIPDPETPLDGDVEIEEPETPLDGTPDTGDTRLTILWGAVGVTAAGCVVAILRKKREE